MLDPDFSIDKRDGISTTHSGAGEPERTGVLVVCRCHCVRARDRHAGGRARSWRIRSVGAGSDLSDI